VNKLLVVAGVLVLFSSMAANLALLRANNQLSARVGALSDQLTAPLGVSLPTLEGDDLTGKPIEIQSQNSGHPTVLFVFSPSCTVCAKNWSNWESLLTSQASLGWRPVFVNTGSHSTAQYQQSHRLDHYETIENISRNTALTYRLYYTPETIILNSEGTAVRSWVGGLSPSQISAFSQTLLNAH
jgi:hypothetical protein